MFLVTIHFPARTGQTSPCPAFMEHIGQPDGALRRPVGVESTAGDLSPRKELIQLPYHQMSIILTRLFDFIIGFHARIDGDIAHLLEPDAIDLPAFFSSPAHGVIGKRGQFGTEST